LEIVVWTYWVGTFKYGRIPATIKIKNLYDVVEKIAAHDENHQNWAH
jgi:hypothetical protein